MRHEKGRGVTAGQGEIFFAINCLLDRGRLTVNLTRSGIQKTFKQIAVLGVIGSVFVLSSCTATDQNSNHDESVISYLGDETPWWGAGQGREFAAHTDYENSLGHLRVELDGDGFDTSGHAFFEPIGTNGRACVTCHQPADSMSLSAQSAQTQWQKNGANDPLFAAIDGSNCPSLPQEEKSSHSLLLDYGLIRVERPWPPVDLMGKAVGPDFEMQVVRDPYGCNLAPDYGIAAGKISVYRRPRPIANMKYLLAMGFATDPKVGMPVPVDPISNMPTSGNFLADRRQLTLEGQTRDAAQTHLQTMADLTDAQIAEIKDFMLRVYTAQVRSNTGDQKYVWLNKDGADGGSHYLAVSKPGQLGSIGKKVWSEFESWETMSAQTLKSLDAAQIEYRKSVTRGARVFRDKMFLITDSAGINSPIGFGNPVLNSCVFCHNMGMMGNDVAPGQVDLGTTTMPFADPAAHLPLFKITCTGDPHPHYGREIYSHDPGFALTTGLCRDVGKITLQSLRGLAARAPYFSNGSAKDLMGVVEYYDRRYKIGYTDQEKRDLVNLMGAL